MIHTDTGPEYLNRSPLEKNAVDLLEDLLADEEQGKEPMGAEGIYCRQCLKIISNPDERIEVQGAHQHTFANPHGIIFEIGCFRTAEGCLMTGPYSEAFSWFKEFSWQVAVCRRCLIQLGWFFSSTRHKDFYALILNRLIFPNGYQ